MNVGNVDDEYVRYMILVQRALGYTSGARGWVTELVSVHGWSFHCSIFDHTLFQQDFSAETRPGFDSFNGLDSYHLYGSVSTRSIIEQHP